MIDNVISKRSQSAISSSSKKMATCNSGNYSEACTENCLCSGCFLPRDMHRTKFCGKTKDLCMNPLKQKSITVLWNRDWQSSISCSLKPRSVEGTTDLRARHNKEQQLSKKFLLEGLYRVLTDKRRTKATGKRQKRKRRAYDPRNRSQSEMCLSQCNKSQLQLRHVLSMMNTTVMSRNNLAVGNCRTGLHGGLLTIDSSRRSLKSTKKLLADSCKADGQGSNSMAPSECFLKMQLTTDSPKDDLHTRGEQVNAVVQNRVHLPQVNSIELCPTHMVRSKSADDLLNCLRGQKARVALGYIGYRNLLRH